MKKKLLLIFVMAMVTLAVTAGTKIYVCGTKITGTTSMTYGGGSFSWNNNTRLLTINNITYTKSGSSNNGISIDEVDGPITISFTGTNSFTIESADVILSKSKKACTINVSGTTTWTCKSSGHAALKLQDGNVTLTGSGTLNINHTNNGHAIKGGAGSEDLTFDLSTNGVCKISSIQEDLYNLDDVNFSSGKVTFLSHSNTSYAHVGTNVSYLDCGTNVYVTAPLVGMSVSDLRKAMYADRTFTVEYIPNFVALLNSSNFPDDRFRSYLEGLFPKGYITTNDVNSCTSINVCDKNIYDLQGIGFFSRLITLDCSYNHLSSLPSLPSTLTYLKCSGNSLTSLPSLPSSLVTLMCLGNNLTSLPTLPSTLTYLDCASNQLTSISSLLAGTSNIEKVYCGNNKFTQVEVGNRNKLKIFDINGTKTLTKLLIYQCNALESVDVSGCTALNYLECRDNSSLTFLGSSLPASVTKFYCYGNQLTMLPALPDGIQVVSASGNRFSTVNVTGKTSLTQLDVSNCTSLTTLNCYSNALTTLSYSGCTALKTLDCSNNKLTSLVAVPAQVTKFNCSSNQLISLPSLPSGLVELSCAYNKLSSLSVQGMNSLTKLEIYGNLIKQSAMGTLVNSLRTIPAGSTGTFLVLGGSGEGNEITTAQVNTARNKRWIPKKYENGNWVDIPAGAVAGDVNGDGVVTAADITALYDVLLNNDYSSVVNGDQTGDGNITAADVTMVYNILLSN